MPTVKVRNLKNEEVGDLELSDAVFGVPFNEPLVHAAVRNFMANGRQGSSATKTRGDVSRGRCLSASTTCGRRALRRCARHYGKAAATCTDHNRATGPTTCQRKC